METETMKIINFFDSSPSQGIHQGVRKSNMYYTNLIGSYQNLSMEEPPMASYSIAPITTKDEEKVVMFLRKFFFRDEPLNVAIGLLDDCPDATCQELEDYCNRSIPDGLSVMAISSTGRVLGVCLNGAMNRADEEVYDVNAIECSNKKFECILKLLTTVSKEAKVFERFPDIDKILDIKIISVDESCRGQGICKALVDRTKQLAIEHDFQMLKIDCSSHYSAKAAARLGFEVIYTLHYDEYLDENGRPIFIPPPPHTCAKTFVMKL